MLKASENKSGFSRCLKAAWDDVLWIDPRAGGST